MSNTLLRRNSSKQGLQNLQRLTAQRSIEDAEEIERERRRRAREALRRRNSGSLSGESPENETLAEDSKYDGSYKPNNSPSLEEDEGFSDWTQRRERRRQQRLQELSQGGEEEDDEEDDTNTVNRAEKTSQASSRLQRQNTDEPDRKMVQMERRKDRGEEVIQAERARKEEEREEQEKRRREESQKPNTEAEKRKEVKVSYTSKVFLQQEPKHINTNGDAADHEVTSYNSISHSKTKKSVRAVDPEEAEAILETEQRLEKIRRSLQEKESQELEHLRHRQVEAEQELEQLKKRREDRRRVREEEERRREEEEQLRMVKEEEEKRQMKEDIERRRMEAAERMKNLSTTGVDGDEMFSPFSPKAPTHKITERTESLNRSLKKSNSFKKTQPPVLLTKIDNKLELYTHAVEGRPVKAAPVDLPNAPEVVASKKNLFEAGDAWSPSPTKGATCKDTEGLKVGVASLITQWVKGPTDSKQSPCKPSDVKAGDVMQKRNMWEGIGDSSGRAGQKTKNAAGGKKYKFIVTGHGKYEKIPVDEEDGGEFANDSCH